MACSRENSTFTLPLPPTVTVMNHTFCPHSALARLVMTSVQTATPAYLTQTDWSLQCKRTLFSVKYDSTSLCPPPQFTRTLMARRTWPPYKRFGLVHIGQLWHCHTLPKRYIDWHLTNLSRTSKYATGLHWLQSQTDSSKSHVTATRNCHYPPLLLLQTEKNYCYYISLLVASSFIMLRLVAE